MLQFIHRSAATQLVIGLTISFLVLAIVVAWPFLFGDRAFAYTDIGTDTFVQFYPLNVAHAQQLASGDGLGWSFSLGLGGYIGTHFDPFWMLQGLLPESAQLGARIYTYLLKLGLGGLFFALYLQLIGVRTNLAVLAGLAYAFSDYATINGQWDLHGTEVLHFSLLLYLLERYMRGGIPAFALGIGLLLGAGHTFNLYTSALFTLVYMVTRAWLVSESRPLAWHLRSMFALGVWVLVGVLVMAPLQLPSLLSFLDSPRVTGDHVSIGSVIRSLFDINNWNTLAATVYGFLGKNSMGVGNAYVGWVNYLEGPGFYIGFLFLFTASQLATAGATQNERRLFWLAAIGILLYVLFPAFRYSVFGFNHIAFRTSTLWISMLILVVGSLGLQRALRVGFSGRAAGAAMAVLVLALAIVGMASDLAIDSRHLAKFGVFVLVYSAVLLALAKGDGRRAFLVVACVFLVELVAVVRPSLVHRDAVGKDGVGLAGVYEDGTPQALQWIRDRESETAFYRVEKDYLSVFLLDSLVQGYHGVRSYFFHGAGVTRFVDSMRWPRTVNHSNYIESDNDRGYVLDMLAVKYILSRSRDRDADPGSRHLASVGGVEIYERPYARSLAVLHTRVFDETDARSRTQEELDLLLTDSAVVDDLASVQSVPLVADVNRRVSVDVPVEIQGSRRISGELQGESSRLLAFSMPFDRGWHLRLDDGSVDVPLIRINFGLLGAVVPAGAHSFELRYETPGRRNAYMLSLIGLVLCLGWWLFARSRGRRRAD